MLAFIENILKGIKLWLPEHYINSSSGLGTTNETIIVHDGTSNDRKVKNSLKTITTTSPSASSTDSTIPTSKAVYDAIGNNAVTSITAGTGLSGGTITSTGTISHATISTTNSTSSDSPTSGGSFTAIGAIETNNGHITSITTKTINLPTDPDIKVKQTSSSTDANYPLLASASTDPNGTAQEAIYDSGIKINPNKHSLTEGYNTVANGSYSHAEGYNTTAFGDKSHIEGNSSNKANSSYTKNTDYNTIINAWRDNKFSFVAGDYSHVEGQDNLVLGANSYDVHVEGQQNIVAGSSEVYGTHVEGRLNVAGLGGAKSHIEGSVNAIVTSGGHAEGGDNYLRCYNGHVEGQSNIVDCSVSSNGTYGVHAEGYCNKVTHGYSHTEGGRKETVVISANFTYSRISDSQFSFTYAENFDYDRIIHIQLHTGSGTWDYSSYKIQSVSKSGTTYTVTVIPNIFQKVTTGLVIKITLIFYSNLNAGLYSHVEGTGNTTLNDGEHAEGKFNKSISGVSQHTVGIGTSHSARKNAHLITNDGKHYILGIGGYQGTEDSLSLVDDLASYLNNLPKPMVFRGNVNGAYPENPSIGDTYKAIANSNIGISPVYKSGDVVVYTDKGEGQSPRYEWVVVPAGDDIEDTWRPIKVGGSEKLSNGITSGSVDFISGNKTTVAWDGTDKTIKYNHNTTSRSNTTSSTSTSHGGTFTAIDSITSDDYGHITGVNTKTITLPSSGNTDVSTSQENTTTDNYSPLLSANKNVANAVPTNTTPVTGCVYFANKAFIQPSTGNIYSLGYVGIGKTSLTTGCNMVYNSTTKSLNFEF